jgi:hypothetical protein
MTVLQLSPPPDIGPGAKYSDYKGWLLSNFHLDICSYCLLQHKHSLSIDRYIPQSYCKTPFEARIDDPENLLLCCQNCGRKKSDYHPDHGARRRLPRETQGFLVLDVRCDDFGQLFEIRANGSLLVRSDLDPLEVQRAIWNVARLLELDLYDEERARLLEKLGLAEQLRALDGEITILERQTLTILERDLAEWLPMLRVFDVPITTDLRARLEELAADRLSRSLP